MKNPSQSLLSSLLIAVLFLGSPAWAAEKAGILDTQTNEKDTTLVFNDTDIRDVLRLIADEYNLNMVMSDDVTGSVTLRLKGASLQNTLDAILAGRGYDYEILDNIIRVGRTEAIQADRLQRTSREVQEVLVTEVIVLRYLDAYDIKDTVKSLLSSRGTVSVLERRPYSGFRFGTQSSSSASSSASQGGYLTGSGSSGSGNLGGAGTSASSGGVGGLVRQRDQEEKPRSNTLLIADVRSQVEKIKELIAKVDVAPRQIQIDARLIEVTTRTLKDLGIDFNNSSGVSPGEGPTNSVVTDINSGSSTTTIHPNILSHTFPTSTDAGIHTVFTKIGGSDMSVVLHALAQDSRTKTLSAPRILTIENQEAAILVGEQFPIFQSTVTDQGTNTESLSYFQPIGISLQVVAQVTPENEINMIVHPTVSSLGSFVTGTSGLSQPRINTREADTRVLMKNGETLVIGGLLQDEESKEYYSVPFFDHVPVIDRLFSRKQNSIDQKNLIIFITPTIVNAVSNMNTSERQTYKGIRDPAHYGYEYDRKKALGEIYSDAKKKYKQGDATAAKALFLRVLALDPENQGAIRYLRKLKAMPAEKPIS